MCFLKKVNMYCTLSQIITCGMLGYAVSSPMQKLHKTIFADYPTQNNLPLDEFPKHEVLSTFISIVLIGPAIEEIVFRKYLPDAISPLICPLTKHQEIHVTSIIFGASHLLNLCDPSTHKKVALIFEQVLVGVLLVGPICWTIKNKINLLASIFFHIGYNYRGISEIIPKEYIAEILIKDPKNISNAFTTTITQAVVNAYAMFAFCTASVYLFSKTIYPFISVDNKP